MPRRSRIEAKIRCLNPFGARIAANGLDRQTAKTHFSVLRRFRGTRGTHLLGLYRFDKSGTAEIVRGA